MAYVVGKFMERSEMKGYDVLLTGDNKILADDVYKANEKWVYALKLLNKTAYNDPILAHKYAVCFKFLKKQRQKIGITEIQDKRG